MCLTAQGGVGVVGGSCIMDIDVLYKCADI